MVMEDNFKIEYIKTFWNIYFTVVPSPPHGGPYGESPHGVPLVEVLVVSGDPRNSIYKVKVMYNPIQPSDVADGKES